MDALTPLIADAGSNLVAARNQMAFTLGFHIVLASLGVAFPAIMLIAEYRGRRHGDPDALLLARRWSKIVAVTFAVGAVTGTVLSFEFGLLWPEFMRRFGDAFGIAFAIEGIFFFIEAIFIAIYIYGWNRLPGWAHFWSGVPIVITGVGGALSVIAANAWMNQPQGFELGPDGTVTDVKPLEVLFNPATPYEFFHMLLAAYMVTGFLIASVYAVGMLRGHRARYHHIGMLIPLCVAAIATPLQLFVGDTAARAIAEDQPAKFAAMECIYETGSDQAEHIGGICHDDSQTVSAAISIPGLDSLLVGFSTGTEVTGLDQFPDSDEPANKTLLHLSFDTMVGIGTALAALAAVLAFALWRRRRLLDNHWFLRAVAASGAAAIVAMWCGWIVTEVGRQPWIVNGYMRTEEAVTDADGLWFVYGFTVALYLALAVTAVLVIRSVARRWREDEAGGAVPYGPGDAGMSKADSAAAILWLGATLYAVFGGADFGAGFWQLLAPAARDPEAVRQRIARSVAPVWEANHVWLIFSLVILWTAFPPAFSAVMTTLYIPLALAALGIVLRGSGFAFGKAIGGRARRDAGLVFSISSILTPFFMGTVVGAIASGEVPAGGDGDPTSSWTGVLPLLTGVLFVAAAAYVAAVFLVHDSGGDEALRRHFRRSALAAATVAGALALAGVFALHSDARFVYDGLVGPGLPLLVLSAVCGLAALVLLAADRHSWLLRPAAVGAFVAMIWGWFVAQHPYLLPTSLTIDTASAPDATLTAVFVVFGAAIVLVVPSLVLLYTLSQKDVLE